MSTRKSAIHRALRWAIVLGLPLMVWIVLISDLQAAQVSGVEQRLAVATVAPRSSFLFRFEPSSRTFFSHTLPLGSLPADVSVTGTNPTHVWVTQPGKDQIGRLVYTSTSSFQWRTYTLEPGIGPFRLAVNGNFVWFTARNANRIGRLNALTGQTDYFTRGLTANSGLADIEVAPSGRVWAAGQFSNRLIRLTVTNTTNYAIDENVNAFPPVPAGPWDLAVRTDNEIWFTAPDSHKLGYLIPSNHQVVLPFGFPINSTPYEIVAPAASPYVWFSDRQRNGIGQIQVNTLTDQNIYTPTMRPTGLASESPTRFWFTQQNATGALGRFVYTSTASTHLASFALPISGLRPTGIAVAADQGVWFAAYFPDRLLLPLVMLNFPN